MLKFRPINMIEGKFLCGGIEHINNTNILPLKDIESYFKPKLLQFQLMGQTNFAKFSQNDLRILSESLLNILGLNKSVNCFCFLVQSNFYPKNCYLGFNIPISILFGDGFDIESYRFSVVVTKYREKVATIFDSNDNCFMQYAGVGLNMNGEFGIIVKAILNSYGLTDYDTASFHFIKLMD